MDNLIGKAIITGKIIAKTGLHIGGSKNTKRIGEIDNVVIKDKTGKPYIPGSSLKGKMRSLLGKKEGSSSVEEDSKKLRLIFGESGDKEDKGNTARLLVRDAYLSNGEIIKGYKEFLDGEYTQIKTENRINRLTGTTDTKGGGLRQIERVPEGSEFELDLVLDIYDIPTGKAHLTELLTALQLLQYDYLGGSGSRGYGKVSFCIDKCTYYSVDLISKESDFAGIFNDIQKLGN